jgi:hypothetical protein
MHLIVYILVQYHTLIYTLELFLYSQAKFQHVLVADTTTIREDNTNQKTPILEGVYRAMHTSLFFTSPLQQRAVYVTPLLYVLVWLAVPSGLEVPLEGAYICAN